MLACPRRLNLLSQDIAGGDGERCDARPEGSGDVAIAAAPVAFLYFRIGDCEGRSHGEGSSWPRRYLIARSFAIIDSAGGPAPASKTGT
jgi:hypothetical protein